MTIETTTTTSEPAGRCVPFLRPHRWTRWRYAERRLIIAGAVPMQSRECLRCGRTQTVGVVGA